MESPPLARAFPKDVRVTNWPKAPMPGEAFWKTVSHEFDALQRQAGENQVAVMRYYTPAGEEIRVVDARREPTTDILIFYGVDAAGYLCHTIVQPHNTQITLRLLPTTATIEEERKPIGVFAEPKADEQA